VWLLTIGTIGIAGACGGHVAPASAPPPEGAAPTPDAATPEPDAATPEPDAAPPLPYAFELTASPSCANASFPLPQQSVRFDMNLSQEAPGWVLRLPHSTNDFALTGHITANSGTLMLRLIVEGSHVTGTASGDGLAGDAAVEVGLSADADRSGDAQLVGEGMFDGTPLSGTLAGNINMGLFALAYGGECTAADHTWRLTPE